MPPDDRFRRDDDKRLFPSRPEPGDGNPEEFVEEVEGGPWAPSLQHGKLLAKNQVL